MEHKQNLTKRSNYLWTVSPQGRPQEGPGSFRQRPRQFRWERHRGPQGRRRGERFHDCQQYCAARGTNFADNGSSGRDSRLKMRVVLMVVCLSEILSPRRVNDGSGFFLIVIVILIVLLYNIVIFPFINPPGRSACDSETRDTLSLQHGSSRRRAQINRNPGEDGGRSCPQISSRRRKRSGRGEAITDELGPQRTLVRGGGDLVDRSGWGVLEGGGEGKTSNGGKHKWREKQVDGGNNLEAGLGESEAGWGQQLLGQEQSVVLRSGGQK